MARDLYYSFFLLKYPKQQVIFKICLDCGCHPEGTENKNTAICDQKEKKCLCKHHGYKGLKCDQCMDFSNNINAEFHEPLICTGEILWNFTF